MIIKIAASITLTLLSSLMIYTYRSKDVFNYKYESPIKLNVNEIYDQLEQSNFKKIEEKLKVILEENEKLKLTINSIDKVAKESSNVTISNSWYMEPNNFLLLLTGALAVTSLIFAWKYFKSKENFNKLLTLNSKVIDELKLNKVQFKEWSEEINKLNEQTLKINNEISNNNKSLNDIDLNMYNKKNIESLKSKIVITLEKSILKNKNKWIEDIDRIFNKSLTLFKHSYIKNIIKHDKEFWEKRPKNRDKNTYIAYSVLSFIIYKSLINYALNGTDLETYGFMSTLSNEFLLENEYMRTIPLHEYGIEEKNFKINYASASQDKLVEKIIKCKNKNLKLLE